jgi:hypothetical protein
MHIEFYSENLMGKPPLGIPEHRLEDNIKLDLKEVGCQVVDRIDLSLYGFL